MITVEDLKLKIRELFLNTPRDISVGYGFKKVGGKYTTEKCIVFRAVKKLPLSEIPENEVLPSSVEIDGVIYNTDVIETGLVDYLACDNSVTNPCFQYGYPPVAANTPNAQLQRPLLGGSFIKSSKSGTLGFIAKHTATGKIVGVSNSHVLFDPPFNFRSVDFSTSRQPTQDLSAGYTIYQPYPSEAPNDAIGKFLYIQPLKRLPFQNQVDGAIMSLTATDPSSRPVLTTQSWKQVGLDIGTTPPPFATTDELDNLLNYPNLEVSSSGARTGPKQGTCGLRISEIHVNTFFGDNVWYDDQLSFTRINPDCNYPVEGGDSGSALFAKINGVWKIIGLVFAGSETEGLACRIDHVAQQLGIEAWDGTLTSSSFVNPSSIQTIITAGTSSQDSLIINGKIYRQSKATISPATFTSTTTTTTTQLSNVWYKMSVCGSTSFLNSSSYLSGTFSVGQVVMNGNDNASFLTITEVLTTQPQGALTPIFGTNLASCPTVLARTYTSTTTTGACNFSGLPFPMGINIGATGLCDATTIYSQFSFYNITGTIYVSNFNAAGSYKQFTVSQNGKFATSVGSCVNCSTGFKSFITFAGTSQSRVVACGRNTLDDTLLFTGPGTYPTIGDTLYSNPSSPPIILNGWIKLANNHVIYGNTSTITDDFDCSLIPTTTTSTTGFVPPVVTTTSTTTIAPLNFNTFEYCNIINQRYFMIDSMTGGSNYYYVSTGLSFTEQAALNGSYSSRVFTTGERYFDIFNAPAGTYWVAIKDALNPSNRLAKPLIVSGNSCPFPNTTTTTTTINPNINNTLYMGFPTPNTTWISFDLLP